MRVCDTYAALTDARPYKTAISEAEAKKYLIEWAGIEFDPLVVKAFLTLEGLRELASFAASGQNQAPESLNANPPETPPSETKEDLSGDNAEQQQQQNTPYSQFWGDDN